MFCEIKKNRFQKEEIPCYWGRSLRGTVTQGADEKGRYLSQSRNFLKLKCNRCMSPALPFYRIKQFVLRYLYMITNGIVGISASSRTGIYPRR
jgi:hypothetical protein